MSLASADASSVRLNQPNQFARSSSPWTRIVAEAGPDRMALRSAGTKAWTSTIPSSSWSSATSTGAGCSFSARRHSRRDPHRRALGHGRDPVAVTRRLAGEEQRPAGREHAVELGERAVEIGQVVQYGVAEHEVEALVLERERGGVAGRGLHLEPELLCVALQRLQHPG